MAKQDYYTVLGVNRSATDQEIQAAYEEKTQLINTYPNEVKDSIDRAYKVLNSPGLKVIYDDNLHQGHESAELSVEAEEIRLYTGQMETMLVLGEKEKPIQVSDIRTDILTLSEIINTKSIEFSNFNNIHDPNVKEAAQQIFGDYSPAGGSTSSKELKHSLKELMDEQITKYQKETMVQYPLGKDSKIYKLLMQGNKKTIARIIDTMSAMQPKEADAKALDAQFVFESSPPELIAKMQEINTRIAERSNRNLGGLKDAINQFCNFLDQVFNKGGIANKELVQAIEEMRVRQQNRSHGAAKEVDARTEGFVALLNKSATKTNDSSLSM